MRLLVIEMSNSTPVSEPDQRAIGALIGLVNQNRTREAEQQTQLLLGDFPYAGILWKILSIAQLRQGNEALPALRRAAELMPSDLEALGNLGAILHDRGQWSECWNCLQKVLELAPTDVNALIYAADALKELGRLADSLPLYHRALKVDPRNLLARNNLGTAFLRLGQYADAVGYYRLALDITPDDPRILCNLGTAQRLLGYLEDALATTRRALALDSSASAVHTHIGLILAAGGDREGAIASYRQALILDSADVDALIHLAQLLREMGLRRDAIALYARAIRCDPKRADSHCNLGMVLFEMRRIDDAFAAFQEALKLQPTLASAHMNIGLVLRQKRQPAEAEASCRRALAIDPDSVEALALLGELLADRGQFVDAETLFRTALSLNPHFAPALSGIATHRKMTLQDTAWAKSAATVLSHPLPIAHEIGLRYSLGKYHDDTANYDLAFEQYQFANELSKRLNSGYDGAHFSQYVEGIKRSFETTSPQRTQSTGAPEVAPIFIVGMPRSGTSLVEQILASHPAVFGAGEVLFWNSAYHALREGERGRPGSGAQIIAHKATEYLSLLENISSGAQRVVDKLPANFLYAGMIHHAFPNARIIHMRRHPIDTCLSVYFQNFFNFGPYANDLHSLAHYYQEYMGMTRYWRHHLPATTWLDVSYEGLLDDQEGSTRRILEFAGLTWDPRCLEFDRTERVVITASKWQVRQKIHKGSAGRWRCYEKHLGPLMALLEADSHAGGR